MIIKSGAEIEPLDIVVIRGQRHVVEAAVPGSNGTFNRLFLTGGFAWPVNNREKLIYLGKADLSELLGIPASELEQ